MGMFDKDKEFGQNLINEVPKDEKFILWKATIDEETVDTQYGDARKTRLIISRKDDPGEKFEVTTLASAIADKAQDAVPEDFPAIVYWTEVDSNFGGKATVLQFFSEYKEDSEEIPF
jgi:hypothetical protein